MKKKHRQHKKPTPPHSRIRKKDSPLTSTAEKLYDLIFSFGLRSCWMSNTTLAAMLGCHKLTVQRNRQLLTRRGDIIAARTGNYTWAMWARYHPGVRKCEVLFYSCGSKMINPWYGAKCYLSKTGEKQGGGNKMLPKLDVGTPYGSTYTEPPSKTADGSAPASLVAESAEADSQRHFISEGTNPSKPPSQQQSKNAVQKGGERISEKFLMMTRNKIITDHMHNKKTRYEAEISADQIIIDRIEHERYIPPKQLDDLIGTTGDITQSLFMWYLEIKIPFLSMEAVQKMSNIIYQRKNDRRQMSLVQQIKIRRQRLHRRRQLLHRRPA